ncbi:hypothetical protein AG1IA_08736 [Rhizoctonia solani AG-1 IA]|uniref:Uncharacterized protein n=1 Tax=Thanatephorus cucumeris (strain AG1-IA) TaxID=983506 RepID=L8WK94_THACA|nr:hypothetical protein AG1IA_08736 [Rhizoctonia solani AG-1 IA]
MDITFGHRLHCVPYHGLYLSLFSGFNDRGLWTLRLVAVGSLCLIKTLLVDGVDPRRCELKYTCVQYHNLMDTPTRLGYIRSQDHVQIVDDAYNQRQMRLEAENECHYIISEVI